MLDFYWNHCNAHEREEQIASRRQKRRGWLEGGGVSATGLALRDMDEEMHFRPVTDAARCSIFGEVHVRPRRGLQSRCTAINLALSQSSSMLSLTV